MNYSPIGTRGNAQTGIRIMCRVLSLSAAYAAAVLSCPFYGVTLPEGVSLVLPDIRAPIYRARLDAACRELAALLLADAYADAAAAAGPADTFNYISGWQ
jgi:hypothetical protein